MDLVPVLAVPPATWSMMTDVRRRHVPLWASMVLLALGAWDGRSHWKLSLLGMIFASGFSAAALIASARTRLVLFGGADALLLLIVGIWGGCEAAVVAILALLGTAMCWPTGKTLPGSVPIVLGGVAGMALRLVVPW